MNAKRGALVDTFKGNNQAKQKGENNKTHLQQSNINN